jgi:hypothetical protein
MDAMLERYKRFTVMKAKLVTSDPVYLKINNNAHTENATAHTLKYSSPRHYAVVFAGGFFRYHKNNPYVINNIILHELAHIVHPYDHCEGFKNVARKLGTAPRYCKMR